MSKVNNANTDKFKVVFSNMPFSSGRMDKPPMAVFDNYVKSVSMPDYNLELVNSQFFGITVKQPASQANNDLTPLIIDFFVDEDVENYATFYEWIREVRCGNPTDGKGDLGESLINSIYVIYNDNENRAGPRFSFNNCYLINLSSLQLNFGTSEQLVFSCTFTYDLWDVTRPDTIRNN